MIPKNNTRIFHRLIAFEAATRKELTAIRNEMKLRSEASEKALNLQAKEYERRLDGLNGEAERLRKMQETYLARDVYNSDIKSIRDDIADLKKFKDNYQGGHAASMLWITLIATIIATVISALIVSIMIGG